MPRAKPKPKKAAAKPAAPPTPTKRATPASLSDTQTAWLDSIAATINASGGPRFTRENVLHALVDAASGRPIDVRKVKTAEDLRIAFGALDLTAVERMLRDRPRIEGGLLKALEDSIK